ncbi:hypothetical protein [Undibacterium rugosum]|uniref:hypothetical protein n=1 Tax=Undibacterium rugosum TaxID=2762291 RepID=UPI001B826F1F|nr:hypothetical protein [Undibacterium rugosum]MBR7777954.1 hypothetical protein [Undibacterium rugosum]
MTAQSGADVSDSGTDAPITQRPQCGCIAIFLIPLPDTLITFSSLPANSQSQLVVAISSLNMGVVNLIVSTVCGLNSCESISVPTASLF